MGHGRSNFLIIISDEHRKDAMGCAGHPIVKTPNLDRLAARGTHFVNAYTPSPMCVPTRAAIATGDHVHRTGNWDSASPFDGRIRSWMRHLRDQGIETVSIGKLHFRSAEDDNGFSTEILPMHVVGGVGWPVGLLRETPPPYETAAELAADVGVGSSTYTDYDLDITAAAEDWLHGKAGSEETWAAFVSLVSPHYPLTCPEEYHAMYDPAQIDLPVGYRQQFRPEHGELKNVADFFDYDRYDLSQEARATVGFWADWMRSHGNVAVTIEGHADERGTREYNLALAARRANAVRDYLGALGISAGRVETISYGKERPAVLGSNAEAWAQNRRGVLVVK